MYGYVYKTTNLVNGKIYIGKHHRGQFDPNYYGSGVLLWRAINKYGLANFTVEMLAPCFSLEELNEEESMIIDLLDSRNPEVGYNLAAGGDGGTGWTKGRPFSDEHRENLSKAHLGHKRTLESRMKQGNSIRGSANCRYGKPMSESTKIKLRKARENFHHSKETKLAMSQRMLGQNNPFYGKKHSDEARARMVESNKNRRYTNTCQKCNSQFISRSPRTKFCDICGGRTNE